MQVTPNRAVLQDGGSRRFATGHATKEGDGHYRYVVARGDTLEGIATRFGVSPNALQSESRGELEIFAGETLQLTTAA
ncbi:LysM peptidoglycan-binding domain-containing protein [uncultured Amnibacterium sp.]|uniref:LysM peptidoglycan-binding domain-containing protein n=1 Tax=uncultured Amnibacterium sp. TaxID=1631851 RepID=UPI0035CB0536